MNQNALNGSDFRSRGVEIGGSSMNALDSGAGPAVVLGPSFLWSAEMWRPQAEALSRRFRVVIPELWGHGRSGTVPPGTSDMKALARQHLELLDRLGVGRFALGGLSVGGMWGAELAIMAPDRVSALVLIDTFLAAEPAASRTKYSALLDAVAAGRTLPDPVREAVVPLFYSPSVGRRKPELPAALDAALLSWDRVRLIDSVVPLGRIIFGRRDALGDLADLPMPALIITGSEDLNRPPAEGRRMAERLGCRFLEVPEAGHISESRGAGFRDGRSGKVPRRRDAGGYSVVSVHAAGKWKGAGQPAWRGTGATSCTLPPHRLNARGTSARRRRAACCDCKMIQLRTHPGGNCHA